jgi:drug/metabolite transporter (DMT)-like permease
MLGGILMGLGAGALWGLTFVAPRAVAPYSEIDLAAMRYAAFGLISILLMAAGPRFRPGRLTARRMLLALWLGLSGFVIYFVCIALAVRLAGPAIAPLVIGALPLLLALYGNWRDKDVSWASIAPALLLIAIGLLVVNAAAFAAADTPGGRRDVLLGLGCAVAGLLVWFLYAITNARAMRSADAPDPLAWTGLQGVGALVGTLPLIALAPAMGWSRIPELGLAGDAGLRLIAWALLTGIVASWVAQYFWTIASKRLPLALSAQLIVSETLFALAYGFAWEGRWPHAAEWAGGGLLILGVFLGVRAFTRTNGSKNPAEAGSG